MSFTSDTSPGRRVHLHLGHQGRQEAAKVFIDSLHLFSLLANVADVKMLVIHPAATAHSQETAGELED
ncbi:PLP-dependent transferase [Bifidobacterium aemilianum]|uniref:PLP-dependent transferase n=1 Tax=Bifidobacterium aemilianum TaxID=2493120 RepID=UPI001EEDE7A9|nr:PLP-dependent transferase [Bifidobacterium aemilianum]